MLRHIVYFILPPPAWPTRPAPPIDGDCLGVRGRDYFAMRLPLIDSSKISDHGSISGEAFKHIIHFGSLPTGILTHVPRHSSPPQGRSRATAYYGSGLRAPGRQAGWGGGGTPRTSERGGGVLILPSPQKIFVRACMCVRVRVCVCVCD